MGFFKRLGKKINRGVFKPIAKAAEAVADVVEDIAEEVFEEVIEPVGLKIADVAEDVVDEIKELPKEVLDEMEKIGLEIQKLERKHRILKYGGDVVGMGLGITGALTGNIGLKVLGVAVDYGTEIASDKLRE